MKALIRTLAGVALAVMCMAGCTQDKYAYKTVEGDPLKAKMYTLPNGLKVYMTVNKEQPRIQTFIAVHAGSKHEPAETTGLAHYLEHMMFKGSSHLGTTNYEQEKVLLDQIRDLYETYRVTEDDAARAAIYKQIDSISYLASTYFIPNEYDKVMAHIGSDGTNAYTSYDQTVYVEDIPANEVENWARVQSDRFKNMVLRGFHTELESVYEEYNMYLNEDWDRILPAITQTLTPTHPYNHTVIGYGDHLKNPSIKNIEAFFHQYYVPNNMAICLSGDFDPDEMVDIITKYFGDMEPNTQLEMPQFDPQPELKAVVEKEVLTQNPENITLTWRFEGSASFQNDTLALLSKVMRNGKAGLFDLDLNLPGKVVESHAMVMDLCDYTLYVLFAMPLPGQTLEELRGMMMAEADKLRKGDFDENLVEAVKTEMKLKQQHALEENESRASMFVDAFINDKDWADEVGRMERISKLTKEDIVAFANAHLREDNYVCVYKRQGEDKDVKPVQKPAITPIQMNRDTASVFARSILDSTAAPIEPVFVDLQRDIVRLSTQDGLQVLYKHNELNDLFQLSFRYELGTASLLDNGLARYLPLAANYLDYLGTDSLTAEQIQQKFYLLGCNMRLSTGIRNTTLTVSGLQENMEEALRLVEHVVSRLKPDTAAMRKLVVTKLKDRSNALETFDLYMPYMQDFLHYGPKGVALTLTNKEVEEAVPAQLTQLIGDLSRYQHRITYYGPLKGEDVVAVLDATHRVPGIVTPTPARDVPAYIQPEEDVCFLLPYKGTKSFVMNQFACNGRLWNADKVGVTRMYDEYGGAGMNTVVFQEMREKRSLCYGAGARYFMPQRMDEYCTFRTHIQSQNDKLKDCITVFQDINNNMPESQTSFDVARQGLLTQLRTQRTCRDAVFNTLFRAEDLGINYDPDSLCYHQLLQTRLADVVQFQQENVRGLKYRSAITGDPDGLDMKQATSLGKVVVVSPMEVFGF